MVEPIKTSLGNRIGNTLWGVPATLLGLFAFGLFYLVAFMWMHLFALVLPKPRRQTAFQIINSWYYASFLSFLKVLLIGTRIKIAPEVRAIRGAVVVANHLSFFDTILMMATFRRQKTIVKGVMFKVPFMGWAQNMAGYLPSGSKTPIHQLLAKRLTELEAFFEAGGVLFVFPEGTRSRTGKLSPFQKGAFNIAAHVGVPVQLVRIENTQLFQPPGKLVVHPFPGAPLRMSYLQQLDPPPDHNRSNVLELTRRAESIFRAALASDEHGHEPEKSPDRTIDGTTE
jgi:1-acyl-sn-glycerol-3-phosphate acyltransferase